MFSRLYLVISLLVLIQFEAYADSATQTDWSGGPDVWGPVMSWEDRFFLDDDVDFSGASGSIDLKTTNTEHIVTANFVGAYSVYSADIDGDGDMDVLGAADEDDDITWWENEDGSGTSWIEHVIDGDFDGAKCVYSEDLDDDGDMDVLGAGYWADHITWWENTDGVGTAWTEHIIDGDFNRALKVYSVDMDGDGDCDVLGSGEYHQTITWWENLDGSGENWDEHNTPHLWNCKIAYPEDIDSDGDMDIIVCFWVQQYIEAISWWENRDGSGTSWVYHEISDGIFDGACSVHSEDLDGDGDIDVLGAAKDDNQIAWWENEGGSGTSWVKHIVQSAYHGAEIVYAEDLDDDGDMDVLGVASQLSGISWWENFNGSGTSWVQHDLTANFPGVYSLYSADIDGDGDMDMLGTAYFRGISWWEIPAYYMSCGSLESSILDTDTEPEWDYLEWNATTSVNTSVSFQVRASDNYTNMGPWSDTLTSSCFLAGILSNGDRYIQYRAILSTSDPDTTSILNDITITWDPLGVGDNPPVSEYLLFRTEPNPAFESVSIGFAVPGLSLVELSIYDLTGRLVIAPAQAEYSMGIHQVQIGELTSGIYFCRMIVGDFTAIQRFAVID